MKPVSIPEVLRHTDEGFRIMTIAAPEGTESHIGSVEAEVGDSKLGPTFLILCRVDRKDMEALKNNHGLFWFTLLGDHLHPFSFLPVPPEDTTGVRAETLETHLFKDQENNVYTPEDIARAFHESYERLAPDFGYETRKESAVPWEEVPENNRKLMEAVVTDLFF